VKKTGENKKMKQDTRQLQPKLGACEFWSKNSKYGPNVGAVH